MADEAGKTRKQGEGGGKIHNAEEFANYVHAVTIPMKIVMLAIILFFAGAIAYCIFGTVPVNIRVAAFSSSNGCVCYVTADDINDLEAGDAVEIDGKPYTVTYVSTETTAVSESVDESVLQTCGLEAGESVYQLIISDGVPQGSYLATITKSKISPINALLFG